MNNRAKIFMPFDALKGFREALSVKEFEHEQFQLGEKSESQIKKLSDILLNYQKDKKVELEYFENGHKFTFAGCIKIDYVFKTIIFEKKEISFEDIIDISLI